MNQFYKTKHGYYQIVTRPIDKFDINILFDTND